MVLSIFLNMQISINWLRVLIIINYYCLFAVAAQARTAWQAGGAGMGLGKSSFFTQTLPGEYSWFKGSDV